MPLVAKLIGFELNRMWCNIQTNLRYVFEPMPHVSREILSVVHVIRRGIRQCVDLTLHKCYLCKVEKSGEIYVHIFFQLQIVGNNFDGALRNSNEVIIH